MMGGSLLEDCKLEVENRPWAKPLTTVGIPKLPAGDRLHHKFGVVDKTTVITGSHNGSEAANRANDETLLVIESPVVAAHFEREFDRFDLIDSIKAQFSASLIASSRRWMRANLNASRKVSSKKLEIF